MPEKSPDFDDFDYEKVLKWGAKHLKAKVVWCDTFVDGHGKKRKNERLAHWALIDNTGFIGFDCIKKKDKIKARKAAAMFIYLWTRGVAASYADRCAQLYACHSEVTKV